MAIVNHRVPLGLLAIDNMHKDYIKALPDWVKCRDAAEGERAIKEKGVLYLPAPGINMDADSLEYLAYKKRASFAGFTSRTIEAYVGLAYSTPPLINSDKWGDAEYIASNCDGAGTALSAQIKKSLADVIITGRGGLLVDYPAADATGDELLANISFYNAESIVNWDIKQENGKKSLNWLILREDATDDDSDTPGGAILFQYRVLWLDDDGNVNGAVFDRYGATIGDYYKVIAAGEPLKEIPFYLINADGTNSSTQFFGVAVPPVKKVVDINLTHYRTDAEMRMAMHYHAMPQPYISGATQAFIDQYKDEPLVIGTTEVLMLPDGATFNLAQIDFNATSFHAELNRLRDTAVELGARLAITTTSGVEAAETIRLKEAGDISIIASIILSIVEAYEEAVAMAAKFMGEPTIEPSIEINTDLLKPSPDAQLLSTLMASIGSGVIGVDVVRNYMRATAIIPPTMSDDDLEADVLASMGGMGITYADDPNATPPAPVDAAGNPIDPAAIGAQTQTRSTTPLLDIAKTDAILDLIPTDIIEANAVLDWLKSKAAERDQ